MNQNYRRNAKNAIEKDFYKVEKDCYKMNNANFGFNCRNNVNNVKFAPIINNLSEISYLKKYYNLHDPKILSFVTSDLLEQEIEHSFQRHLAQVKHNDPFRNARITALESQNREDLDVLEALKKKDRRFKKRVRPADVETKLEEVFKNKTNITMTDFHQKNCNGIKSVALKTESNVNVTSRFIRGKMLMFAKVSLNSFIYDMIDVFCFPNVTVQEIYARYDIKKFDLYLSLTKTDSCSLFFIFICATFKRVSREI